MSLSEDDFAYLLKRLGREADSPAGRALRMCLIDGRLPIEAIKATGVPMVRFGPIYDSARQAAAALTLTEADGFTAEELPLANRALRAARAKETAYVPSSAELFALEHLHNLGGVAVKSVSGGQDQLPQVQVPTLWALHANGAVSAEPMGGPMFLWSLTDKGRQLREARFRK